MQLLLGFLPLVAFYVGETFGDLRTGILAAIGASLLDAAYGRWKHGRLNRIVLFSTALVVVLGGLSLLSEDERFVLWTPVLGDLVFATLLAGSLFTEGSALEIAMAEQQPDTPVDAPTRRLLRGVTGRFALNLLVHAALTAWATTQPRETWLFVSGPLQYVLMGLQAVYEVVAVRRLPPATEP